MRLNAERHPFSGMHSDDDLELIRNDYPYH